MWDCGGCICVGVCKYCLCWYQCCVCRIPTVLQLPCWQHSSCYRPTLSTSHAKNFQWQETVIMYRMLEVSELFWWDISTWNYCGTGGTHYSNHHWLDVAYFPIYIIHSLRIVYIVITDYKSCIYASLHVSSPELLSRLQWKLILKMNRKWNAFSFLPNIYHTKTWPWNELFISIRFTIAIWFAFLLVLWVFNNIKWKSGGNSSEWNWVGHLGFSFVLSFLG
jgi:hypothetical protein